MKLSQGSSDWTLGEGSSLREWLVTRTTDPRKVIMAPSLSELKECLFIEFNFRWTCDEQEAGLDHHYGLVPA